MWSLHDRFEGSVDETTCSSEIESFATCGQLLPVVGRRLVGDANYEVELIYGARRLFAARKLDKPLAVEIRELTDREGIIIMDIENRQRKDLTAYERGVGFAHWLRVGLFDSQEALAKDLGISAAQISRLLRLAQLPAVILDAFAVPLVIRESWALNISEALCDPDRRSVTIKKARSIAAVTPRPPPREVYRQLLTAAIRGRKVRSTSHDEAVKDTNGEQLFRIRYYQDSVALIFSRRNLTDELLFFIREAVVSVLTRVMVADLRPS
jgi:ParB family chromosome partitioning protein